MTNQMTCLNECATFSKASMYRTDLLHRSHQNNNTQWASVLRHDRRLIRTINKLSQMKGTEEIKNIYEQMNKYIWFEHPTTGLSVCRFSIFRSAPTKYRTKK